MADDTVLNYWDNTPELLPLLPCEVAEYMRSLITLIRPACVGREAVLIGRSQCLVLVEDMQIKGDGWWVMLSKLWPGKELLRLEFGLNDECELTSEFWYFPHLPLGLQFGSPNSGQV